MNPFENLLRFFPVFDNGVDRPRNLDAPDSRHATLPVVAGDSLRFLMPIADCRNLDPARLAIGLRLRSATTDTGTLCGRVRKQAAESYTEIRLRVTQAPTAGTYKQFSLMLGDKPVLGTFRGQQTDLDDYLNALVTHYQNYPYATVHCDRRGNDLRLRVFPNDRFRLNGETLTVGLGTVRDQNDNSPSLTAQKTGTVAVAAQDCYTVEVGSDIAPGNVFTLGSQTYTARGSEKPADILTALGVSGDKVIVPTGQNLTATAVASSETITNTNRPTISLLYDSNSGGNDLYIVSIGADFTIGNVYQISASGMTTRSKTVTGTDTKASIEAFLNNTGGKLAVPAGSVPTGTVATGTQPKINTNSPSIRFSDKVDLPAHSEDQYRVFVGGSIAAGNGYSLTIGSETTTVTAVSGDTPASIAARLGYTAHPFSLSVDAGTSVIALARKGPKWAAANIASINLLSVQTLKNLNRVAEVVIPSLAVGEYQLTLYDTQGPTVIGLSNPLTLQTGKHETALVRFGGMGPVMGFDYYEDGLMQQLRLPVYVDAGQLRQEENIYRTLDNQPVRSSARAYTARRLTTRLAGEGFHRAMYIALKHPFLYVDGSPYRQEGDYTPTPPQGKQRKSQATASLVAIRGWDYQLDRRGSDSSQSATYALITTLTGLDGLWMAAKRLSFVQPIAEGSSLPAADYSLLIRCGPDKLRLTIAVNGYRAYTALLTPGRLNRIDGVRLSPGRISLLAEVVSPTVISWTADTYNPQLADVVATTVATQVRPGDFNADFNSDFSKL